MEEKNYSSDSPVQDKTEDRFSRWTFSERIAQVISRRNDPSSIVIGLYGIWGDGKTSVLNFIEKSLTEDKNVICIRFNPWRFGTEEELLTGFFFDIAEALDTELIKTEDKLKDFVKKAAPGAGALFGAKGVGDSIGSFISWPNIIELKARIERELEKAKRRVLVLIDDVDRLENTEIHALFRLVKLTADFKYTSYILAFDKDIVAASLNERYSISSSNPGEAFLEKIIQIPLQLPSVEKSILRDFCFQGVDEAISLAQVELTPQQEQEFVRSFTLAFDDCLTTPRKAKLYGNTLMFSLPILQGEVNNVDLMLIEGVRIFCPPLYDVLRKNKELFTGAFHDGMYSNHDKEKETIKSSMDSALDAAKEPNKEGYIQLLMDLFPKVQAVYKNISYSNDWYETWESGQRICSNNYFSRYFGYSIPAGDIPDRKITEVISSCGKWKKPHEQETNPLCNIISRENAENVISKLRRRANSLTENESLPLAIAITQMSPLYPNQSALYSWTTPFSQAAILVSDLIQNLQPKKRASLAKTCISSAPSLEFKFQILRWLKREEEDKPEKDAFSEQAIDKIGKYLGKEIITYLSACDDITTTNPESVSTLLYSLNKHVGKGYANEYVTDLLQKKPEAIMRILDSYVPTAWTMETGLPHKSDFDREQYDSLTKQLSPSIIINALEALPGGLPEVGEDFPRSFSQTDDTINAKQFVWLHNYVANEGEQETAEGEPNTPQE